MRAIGGPGEGLGGASLSFDDVVEEMSDPPCERLISSDVLPAAVGVADLSLPFTPFGKTSLLLLLLLLSSSDATDIDSSGGEPALPGALDTCDPDRSTSFPFSLQTGRSVPLDHCWSDEPSKLICGGGLGGREAGRGGKLDGGGGSFDVEASGIAGWGEAFRDVGEVLVDDIIHQSGIAEMDAGNVC